MKKTNFPALLFALFLLTAISGSAFAQNGGKESTKGKAFVGPFDDGKTLTSADIRFLNSINEAKGDREAVVNDKIFKTGQKLSNNEAALLNKIKSNFRRKHKMEKAMDARPMDKTSEMTNCLWYSYCDGGGACYYVWYCD